MPLVVLLIVPLVAAVATAFLPATARTRAAALSGSSTLIGLAGLAYAFPRVRHGEDLVQRIAWVPELGLDLVLRLDGLSWVFGVLVLGIGGLIILYARYYLSPTDPVSRFYSFLLAFMASMLGVILSGNVVQLAFFWELTSVFSFLLIGYWTQRKDAQRGARMALTVTGVGGLCALAGLVILGRIAGTYGLQGILDRAGQVQAHPLYPVALGLILIGAFTKSAQFPFHFWLPNAMAAPTPVSAYLHSATLVKLGVFLLARLWPVLSGTQIWFWWVGATGLVTLLLGAWVALFQRDLKGLLAYSTISHLGLIILLLGLNSTLAAVAAVFHALNHAAFKASLFMAVGIIDHETGTRDIRRLSGLFLLMPITSTLALVATAAMAGVPLLNGFLSKEMFFAETVFVDASPLVRTALPLAATVAGIFSVAYSLRFAVEVFFGPSSARDTPRKPEEPPGWMRVPIEVLVLLCLVVGVAPAASIGPFLEAAAWQVAGGTPPEYSLKVWHGFTPALLMSGLALAGGTVLYLGIRPIDRRGVSWSLAGRIAGATLFFGGMARLTLASRWIRARVLAAGLQRQLLVLVVVTLLVGLWPLTHGIGKGNRPLLPLSPIFAGLWAVGALAAVTAAWQAKFHRLTALMLAGTTGAICCITFIWFSGPDLALTQLTVEVVTTLLILLGLRWLPPRARRRDIEDSRTRMRRRVRRTRDFIVSASAGLAMAGLSYAVMRRDFPERTSFFLEKSLSEADGRNVVNVMLVDFRGFDTFGEGIVLAIVALTVYALLRRFRPAAEVMVIPPQQQVLPRDLQTDLVNPRQARDPAVGYLTVPAVLVRLLLPVSGLVAVFFFLRGHDAPGGGFVAGLIMSLGILLQYLVSGTEWVEERVGLRPRALIAVGILLTVVTAAAPLVVGYPVLTSHTFDLRLPILGEVHVGSSLFFDLGVFCLVLGSTLFILVALAHQSVRADRAAGGE